MDLAFGSWPWAAVVDDVVGPSKSLLAAALGRHDGAHLVGTALTAGDSPFQLELHGKVHHQNPVHALVGIRFEQERGLVDNHRLRNAGANGCCPFRLQGIDAGMEDGVQTAAQVFIGEDTLGQPIATEAALVIEDVAAESGRYLGQGLGPGRHDLPGELVGFQDVGAALTEAAAYAGFAGADAPGETDVEHGQRLSR